MRFFFGEPGRVAQQVENMTHVRHVFFAQLAGLAVFEEIEITVGQAQSALIHFGNHLLGILVILIGAKIEEHIIVDHACGERRDVIFRF